MMHQPFIPALLTLCECARVSNRYVLHIENKNYGLNSDEYKHNAICLPKNNDLHQCNKLPLDYKSFYEYIGFKTITNYDIEDPNVDGAIYTLYLGEKITQ